jgi:putative FmdB family regulatory protein
MPIYEYKCERCGNITEKMESINNADSVKECPVCGAQAKRIISNSSFQLKGNGWYATDYRKQSAKPAACPANPDSPACAACAAHAKE